MQVEGPQTYQMNCKTNSFQNIWDMLEAKMDRLAKKIDGVQKNTSKSPILVDTNLGYLTLEGPGRQTLSDPFLGLFLVICEVRSPD